MNQKVFPLKSWNYKINTNQINEQSFLNTLFLSPVLDPPLLTLTKFWKYLCMIDYIIFWKKIGSYFHSNSQVIRQKGRLSKRALQENKTHHIFRKTNISHLSFGVLCFLITPVLRFVLLHCYRQISISTEIFNQSCSNLFNW